MIWAVFSYSSLRTMNFCLSASCCWTALLSTALAYSLLKPKFMKLTSSTLTLKPCAFSKRSFLISLLIFYLNFNNWSASSELGYEITLSDNCSENLLADGVEDFLFIITTQELMDGGEMFGDGLLEDSQWDGDCLQVFGTGDDVNIDWPETAVVDDGGLMIITLNYLDSGN